MVGNPNRGRLYYRCTASRDYVRQHQISHPPVLYLREDQIIDPIDRFLRDELTGAALADNLRRVADAQHRAALAEARQPRRHRQDPPNDHRRRHQDRPLPRHPRRRRRPSPHRRLDHRDHRDQECGPSPARPHRRTAAADDGRSAQCDRRRVQGPAPADPGSGPARPRRAI
ncbi:hypothetical protein [Actinoplanes sp. DH11]|uniref:hypothetical protein n=1 Tax=Actinoplanes sp. DH11 TaxID=2857011 RepID=UPI0035AE1C24